MRALLLVLVLALWVTAAVAHPDLEFQIEALDAAIRAQPENAVLYLDRGDLHRRHGDLPAAQADFSMARKLDPRLADLDWREGRALAEAGDVVAAERLLSRFLALDPDHPGALEQRALVCSRQGRHQEAAADLELAIQSSQNPAPGLYTRLVVEWLAADPTEPGPARQWLAVAMQRFPAEVSLLGLAVDIELSQSQASAARRLLQASPPALRQLPQWVWRWALLGCLEGDPQAVDALVALVDRERNGSARPGTWLVPALQVETLLREPGAQRCGGLAAATLQQDVAQRLGEWASH
jgi:predicted Zn-dependent protease